MASLHLSSVPHGKPLADRDVLSSLSVEESKSAFTPATVSEVDESVSASDSDEFLTVTWDGSDDAQNPKNWSVGRKWATSLIVSVFAFLPQVGSSITAPALAPIGEELSIPLDSAELQLVLSIFLLAYGIGPFVLSPCSELWGRAPVLRYGNALFVICTAACGFAQSQAQITAFRFLAGLGGASSVGMSWGVLTDCWRPEDRGKGSAISEVAQVLGPAIGPIVGGYISQNTTWRWCFFTIVFLSAIAQLLAAFFLRETYGPALLQRKAQSLRTSTGDSRWRTEREQSDADRSLPGLLRISLSRPWIMLGTQPIIQMLALYQAFNSGTFWLLISGFPALWEGRYGMARGTASLNYISLAVGCLIGISIFGPLTNRIYTHLKRRNGPQGHNEPGAPEFRIPLLIPVSLVSPCGLFLFAWSAQAKVHFLVPNLGVVLYAGSQIISYQCISAYIADAYEIHTASASAACAVLRSLLGFAFPLFAPALFGKLGYGWGGSVLGLIAVVLGIPAPWIIWFFGPKLRGVSRYAAGEKALRA